MPNANTDHVPYELSKETRYYVIAEPPFDSPSLHVNDIDVGVLYAMISFRLTGASAYVIIMAPLPGCDATELP